MIRGGHAGKAGDRYEARWAVRQMLRLLDDEAEKIEIESSDPELSGFEFTVHTTAGREYHQVKRQQSSSKWSIASLRTASVLDAFWHRLVSDAAAVCVFASTLPAPELRELCERASRTHDAQEFENSLTDPLRSEIHRLGDTWKCSPVECYEPLRKIRIESYLEDDLEDRIREKLYRHVTDPQRASDTLFKLYFDRLGQTVTAHSLWEHLDGLDFERADWAKNNSVLTHINAINERFRRKLEPQLILGEMIERPVARTLPSTGEENQPIVLLGEAGSGKSAVLLAWFDLIRRAAEPLIALSADRLVGDVQTAKKIGESLDLPESPAKVLARVAQGGSGWLLIDQLDSVGSISGRNPELYDVVLELIEQARKSYPNITVVLACRQFDFKNDRRFQLLKASSISIEQLTDEQVELTVERSGYIGPDITARQRALLRLPLRLTLFTRIVSKAPKSPLTFDSTSSLYDRFWKDTIRDDQTKALDVVCRAMSDNQRLYATAAEVSAHQEKIGELVSSGVLSLDEGRCQFFHESFFDYTFALSFVRLHQSLVGWLTGDEQDLFRRGQVRQILQHLRERDHRRYLEELSGLLRWPELRSHLLHSVMAWLGSLNDPSKEEWRVVSGALGALPPDRKERLWHDTLPLLRGSRQWFDHAQNQDDPARWLASGESFEPHGIAWVLTERAKDRPDVVVALLQPYLDSSDEWLGRIGWVISLAPLGEERKLLDLFLALVERGIFDEGRKFTNPVMSLWSQLREIAGVNPERASEVLACAIRRAFERGLEGGRSNPFKRDSPLALAHRGEEVIEACFRGDPEAFLRRHFDLFMEITEANVSTDGEAPFRDSIWSSRRFGRVHDAADAFLSGVDSGLRKMATEKPDLFSDASVRLRAARLEIAHVLLARAWAASAQRFADVAVDWILEDEKRFYLGTTRETSAELVSAVTPYCSEPHFRRLESALLTYYPDFEKRAGPFHSNSTLHGVSQHHLLHSMSEMRLSSTALLRLAELDRKYGRRDKSFVSQDQNDLVDTPRSPIPDAVVAKLTDEQWLGAMRTYRGGPMHWREDSTGRRVGGASELAQQIRHLAAKQPAWGLSILERLPDDANWHYPQAIVWGIEEGVATDSQVYEACQSAHRFPDSEVQRFLCHAVADRAEGDVPDSLVENLCRLAVSAPHPAATDPTYSDNLSGNGLSTVRGSAAYAIGKLLFADTKYWPRFRPIYAKMVRDPSLVVRANVAYALIPVIKIDGVEAVNLFRELTSIDDDILLADHWVGRFLRYAWWKHYPALEPLLPRMRESENEKVQTEGGLHSGIVALLHPEAAGHADACFDLAPPVRQGLAKMAATNVKSDPYRDACARWLERFFDDPDEDTRGRAAECFWRGVEGGPKLDRSLIRAFIKSRAFEKYHDRLLDAFDHAPGDVPAEAFDACERIFEIAGPEIGQFLDRVSYHMVKIIPRLRHLAVDRPTRLRWLNLVDQLTEHQTHGLEEALAGLER